MSSSKVDDAELDHDQPLLNEERPSIEDIERLSLDDDIELPSLAGERTPDYHYQDRNEPPKKRVSAIWIAIALVLAVVGFAMNTEATAYFEDELGWKKPFATMYVTHSTIALPWMCHVAYLRWKDRHVSFKTWLGDYTNQIRGSVATVEAYATGTRASAFKRQGRNSGPLGFLFFVMAIVTLVLTVSGMSWFVSLAYTTPADLSAIYNCSTFFAAAFSVPLLKERLSWISISAVALSIIGTFVIAYGDTTVEHEESAIGSSRLVGNLIACVGAVAFGLYEVLLKKWACPSRPESTGSSIPLTLAASGLTGFYTFTTLWIALIALHFLHVETFVWPNAYTILWIIIAVLSGSMSLTLVVVLVVWTNPIFGSFANVLGVFFVAFADWAFWGLAPSLATYIGGAIVIVAFTLLAVDTLGVKKH